ncbi:beta strand repeat-containing protein, partial [Novimethylophilus kurashikiensis]|uniref:beta strand repeat-containing protein n=1 Tax=Novimethylophilus kurashikiensis TaxID=1825523 RepID=UPI001D131755
MVGVSGNSGTGDVVRVENPFNPPPEPTTPDDGAIDTVLASITYSLGANVEDLTLTGSASISGTGNELDNVLTGNAAANTLTGNEGNDTLNGGVGADTLIGGLGDDIYVVDNVLDVVTENANEGTDTVNASVGYSLAANIENLTLSGLNTINGTGNELDNVLTGNDAANILDGGLGADTLIGGKGGDTYVVDNANDVVTESLIAAQGGGIDLVKASITYVLGDNLDNLTLTGTDDIDGTGNSLNNTIIGNDGANALYGAGGIDILKGGKGDDTYTVDLIKVGTGTTAIAALQDSVTENLNEGTDTVILTGSVTDLTNATTLTLGANLDNLDASGTGTTKLNLTGNLLANELTGNDANNVLDGGLGADTLIGGLGNDTYVVDNVGDTITENTDEGTELVKVNIATANGTYTLEANVDNATLINAVAYNLTGNTLDNVLTGNGLANTLTGDEGADTLNGGAGADSMIGGLGDDVYVVDNTLDTVTENADEGTDTVRSSVSFNLATQGANVENLTLIGAALNG